LAGDARKTRWGLLDHTSTGSALAYSYDPYGKPLQATAPTTDFVYAGMFYNADSGLYLTQYRGYDPVAGRWLSRDPVGEGTDPAGNLYAYVGGNPVSLTDPLGLCPPQNYCQLPNGDIVPYTDLGNGMVGTGAAIGQAGAETAMPTSSKPGGIAGGGKSGPVTSPASRILRDSAIEGRVGALGGVTGTTSVGGSIGRAIPFWGAALGFFDFMQYMNAPVCVPII
jgi:RHS repeat-associated protein